MFLTGLDFIVKIRGRQATGQTFASKKAPKLLRSVHSPQIFASCLMLTLEGD